MKKIIAIITIGAATASLQLSAQEAKTSEKETYPEAQEEVIGEREQPSADYQHNQYGTYPQGIDSTVVPQTRVEISQTDLPEDVSSSFEGSKYSGQEIVAIYKVEDEANSEMQELSNESDQPISDPTPHNELNERSQVQTNPSPETEMSNPSEENQTEVLSNTETETSLNENPDEQSNSIDPRPSDTEMYDSIGSETANVTYEIEVKDNDDNHTILTFTESGELEEASEESSM